MYAVQWCYNLLGQACEKMGDYEAAINYYKKSLEIEYSEETEKRINDLAMSAPTLAIEQKCGAEVVNEGEKVDVILTIKNETKRTDKRH